MKRYLSLAFLLFTGFTSASFAQCISGDCFEGKGTYVYPSGAKYIGQFVNGKIHGEGILYFSNGNKYIGNWENHYREGKGRMEFQNGDTYIGQFRKSKMSGIGEMRYANGDKYEGEWAEDLKHGKGKYHFADKSIYEGEFSRDKMHGEGVIKYPNGDKYVGNWKNNKKDGQGSLEKQDGTTVEGFWENGSYVTNGQETPVEENITVNKDNQDLPNCNKVYCAEGKGVYTYADGSRYVGEFLRGKPLGQGTCYYSNGDKYVGHWKNHAPHGEGIMYFSSGRQIGAIWENGKAVKELEPQGEKMPDTYVQIDEDKAVKIWAVVVGVARYVHMPVLKYTDDDAYQIYAFLKSPEGGALPDNQIKVLIDEDATRLNVLKAMREVFLRADENDVVLFYFSGHGLQGAFLPVDFDGFHNKLKHEDIKEIFASTNAKHKVCFADACHSGSLSAQKSTELDGLMSKYYKAFQTSSGGTALLVSSKSDEYSLEDMGLRQGVFSHFLIRGLKGEADKNKDQIISIQELFDFIFLKVRNYTANAQTPSITGRYDPKMPVAVVR